MAHDCPITVSEYNIRRKISGNRRQTLVGRLIASRELSEDTRAKIPTMVTADELDFLENFFASVPIDGDILEVGPYLGGSTQAIGKGLIIQEFKGTLHVIDTFNWPSERFRRELKKDFDDIGGLGKFGASICKEIEEGEWLNLFYAIHRGATYESFMRLHRFEITADRKESFGIRWPLNKNQILGAVFIDGFKSWEITFNGMSLVSPHLREGTYIIFQDFSWCDCYWIPIFLEYIKDNVEFHSKIDNLAVFKVVDLKGFNANIERFSENYKWDSSQFYSDILRDWSTAQFHSGDDVGFLCHTAQRYIHAVVAKRFFEAAEILAVIKILSDTLDAKWLMEFVKKDNFTIVGF